MCAGMTSTFTHAPGCRVLRPRRPLAAASCGRHSQSAGCAALVGARGLRGHGRLGCGAGAAAVHGRPAGSDPVRGPAPGGPGPRQRTRRGARWLAASRVSRQPDVGGAGAPIQLQTTSETVKLLEPQRQELAAGLRRIAELDEQIEGAQRGHDEAASQGSGVESGARGSVRGTRCGRACRSLGSHALWRLSRLARRSAKEQATASSRLAHGVPLVDPGRQAEAPPGRPALGVQAPDYEALLQVASLPCSRLQLGRPSLRAAPCSRCRRAGARLTRRPSRGTAALTASPTQSCSSSLQPCSWRGEQVPVRRSGQAAAAPVTCPSAQGRRRGAPPQRRGGPGKQRLPPARGERCGPCAASSRCCRGAVCSATTGAAGPRLAGPHVSCQPVRPPPPSLASTALSPLAHGLHSGRAPPCRQESA